MINKKFMLFISGIEQRIMGVLDIYCTRRSIKKKIANAMYIGSHLAMWYKKYPEAFDFDEACVAEYLENHQDWIKRKGYNIKIGEDTVIISW